MIYSHYAPIYDAGGQDWFGQTLARRILDALPHPRRALDLACGTGAATLIMAAAGTRVVAIDRAPAMLEIARGRARDQGLHVRFIEADIRHLRTAGRRARPRARADGRRPTRPILRPASFDLITCLYDSLNYLAEDNDLGQVIRMAGRLLRPGGYFVFDLNTEYEFAHWDDSDQVVCDTSDLLIYNRLSYDPDRRRAYGRIVWFVREIDRWWRGEEQHVERAWSDAEVRAAIENAGLQLEARRTPLWDYAPSDAPRIVYVARRPYISRGST